jgi:hypothetical protein
MDSSMSMALEQLAKGSLLKLRDAQGCGVAVFSGSLWITQEGDLRDVIVEAGDSMRLNRGGLAVIEALADTRLLLLDPIAASAPLPRPSTAAPHRKAQRQRSIAISDRLLNVAAVLRRP